MKIKIKSQINKRKMKTQNKMKAQICNKVNL